MARTGLQKGIKKADTFQYPFLIFFIGRGDMIRTRDILVPNQALYQAELCPVNRNYVYYIFFCFASVFLTFFVTIQRECHLSSF